MFITKKNYQQLLVFDRIYRMYKRFGWLQFNKEPPTDYISYKFQYTSQSIHIYI